MKNMSPKKRGIKVKVFSKKKSVRIDKIISELEEVEIDVSKIQKFNDLPLSTETQKGLRGNGYKVPTEIQKESLVHSLKGLDILGAAKTGSGKTLAFLIPVLETLFKKKWTRLDGVGALIITPTRELAYQIFETLRKVGFYHNFSAGLIIGGKDLHFEKHRMNQVNIIICTPGRLLQHMDENPLMDCANMQILVLDEADRCLDLGFEKTMNSIIENLPSVRQTLLFSATQTKSVRDLARLSLKDPKYVSVHEHAKFSTPEGLTQNYIVCELHEKMALLWSFIKNHPRHKILVFLSSCKQVKYMFEIMCKLRPPNALLALYGTLHQEKRMKIYDSFVTKPHAVLFATDIAARGLDFPEVNWVVQMDCPEDANTYIHRAGRTARYHKGGESLLLLLPSEREGMIQRLEEKKIPINEIKVNPMKLTSPQVKMEAFLAKDPDLKASAQRAFVAYIKSIFLMKDKTVFNVSALNTDAYARSLGLVVSPRIRFLQKHMKTEGQSIIKTEGQSIIKTEGQSIKSESKLLEGRKYFDGGISAIKDENKNTLQRMLKEKETYDFGGGDSESGSDEDLLTVKRQDHQLEGAALEEDEQQQVLEQLSHKSKKKPLTKPALAKKLLKKKIVPNKKIVFTDSGEVIEDQLKSRTTEEGRQYEEAFESGIDITEAKRVMKAEDKLDRKLFREKIKARHKEKKLKEKNLKKRQKEEEDEEVKLYSGSESEGSGPDLSWLPDPDKVFNSQSGSEQGRNSNSENESDASDRGFQTADKRKKKQKLQKRKKRLKVSPVEMNDEGEPADIGSSLKEDEDLVLKFLSGNR